MPECSLCGADQRPPCRECHRPVDGPILESIVVRKRRPAFVRRETIRLCEDCSDAVWAVFDERKQLHPLAVKS